MEYITKVHGGWDEWDEKYYAVVGLRLDDGTEIKARVFDEFTDTDGNPVRIELPMRDDIDGCITVDRDEPSYNCWEFNRVSEFEAVVDFDDKTVDLSGVEPLFD